MNHSFFANKKQPAGNRFLAGCFACWRAVPMCESGAHVWEALERGDER